MSQRALFLQCKLRGRRKKKPRTGGSAAKTLNFWGSSGGEGRTVESEVQCRGLKKEGGNLLRGVPPTKMAPTAFANGAFMALFNFLTFVANHRQRSVG
jgi:hypothetical protein